MYDSRAPEDEGRESEEEESDSEEEQPGETRRVLVFTTQRNIEFLCQSKTRFLDGTFNMLPNIFVQIFTILGIRARAGRPDETAPTYKF